MTIRSYAYQELCHPGVGPRAEAEALYVRGLQLRDRLRAADGPFVIWDVGLGGAANALVVIDAARDIPGALRVVSFDRTTAQLAFALQHLGVLDYFADLAPQAEALLRAGTTEFSVGAARVSWQLILGDFSRAVQSSEASGWPKPHAILFDPHSPAANPEMWAPSVFEAMFALLDPRRPCSLATYSRSTRLRVALLLAGFWVGTGGPTGLKEETTVAANHPELIGQPLGTRWLQRARKSKAAEPLDPRAYGPAPLRPETWNRLRARPQFVSLPRV
jgi:tRNA U34 5-methylaminomethyl-2-thiouridine-forming methyltransferase MnmC